MLERNWFLGVKGPRIHSFKMATSINHIVKIINKTEPNFVLLESLKNIGPQGNH